MTLIVRPIFQAPSGYWWAWSQIKPNRYYSLHTKNRSRAQAIYDGQVERLRQYDEQEQRRSKPAVRLWQPGDNSEGD